MRHTMKVYKDSALHKVYLSARFPTGISHPKSFELEGHRWAYQHTSFDDSGDYDLLYRFTDDEPEEEVEDVTTLRDTFAALAMQCFMREGESISVVPRYAYEMADAMLAARSAVKTDGLETWTALGQ